MIQSYFNLVFMLMCSWAVYFTCQHDAVLPVLMAIAGGISCLLRLGATQKRFVFFERIPLSVVIISSGLFGYLWRMFVPIPEEASSPFPEFTAALQSGSILAALFIWLKPFHRKNHNQLIFCAWLTTALSINVPFHLNTLIVFSTFCFVSIAIIILNTMHRPRDPQFRWMYIRQFVGFSTLLIGLTTVLFFVIARSIVALDGAFLNMMSDYILPRGYTNFLMISPKLNLINPGLSAFDRRPVMEVQLPKVSGIYLKFQVFQTYRNGVWFEPPPSVRYPVATSLAKDDTRGQMTLFTAFQNILPSPYGTRMIRGRGEFDRSEDHIIYSRDKRNTQVIEFGIGPKIDPVALTELQRQSYLTIPDHLQPQIKAMAKQIVGEEKDQVAMIRKIVEYFRTQFAYSLDVDFTADDEGLMKMLKERRPAYCTYFASATTLLLRAQGIPARVAAGFMTSEVTDPSKNTFLVRVKNAHAWTEVYWENRWLMVDATPTGTATPSSRSWFDFDLESFLEKMWIVGLRWHADLENMDRDQLKMDIIGILLLVMLWINRSSVWAALQKINFSNWQRKKRIYSTPSQLIAAYRQYEQFLKIVFQEARSGFDTDEDVLSRIKAKPQVKRRDVELAEQFVTAFQAVRFGQADSKILLQLLRHIRERFNSRHTQ